MELAKLLAPHCVSPSFLKYPKSGVHKETIIEQKEIFISIRELQYNFDLPKNKCDEAMKLLLGMVKSSMEPNSETPPMWKEQLNERFEADWKKTQSMRLRTMCQHLQRAIRNENVWALQMLGPDKPEGEENDEEEWPEEEEEEWPEGEEEEWPEDAEGDLEENPDGDGQQQGHPPVTVVGHCPKKEMAWRTTLQKGKKNGTTDWGAIWSAEKAEDTDYVYATFGDGSEEVIKDLTVGEFLSKKAIAMQTAGGSLFTTYSKAGVEHTVMKTKKAKCGIILLGFRACSTEKAKAGKEQIAEARVAEWPGNDDRAFLKALEFIKIMVQDIADGKVSEDKMLRRNYVYEAKQVHITQVKDKEVTAESDGKDGDAIEVDEAGEGASPEKKVPKPMKRKKHAPGNAKKSKKNISDASTAASASGDGRPSPALPRVPASEGPASQDETLPYDDDLRSNIEMID